MTKTILFLTGTRADYGKIKPLIRVCMDIQDVEPVIAVTGMHCLGPYGLTWKEVEKDFSNPYVFHNQNTQDSGATVLSKTVARLEDLCAELSPDLLVAHGDRIETLAAAATGALMNVRVGHIEGGEVSGTIDESIRHAVSKLAHVHFVSNEEAAARLRSFGEPAESVFVIGSPELDLADSPDLPSLEDVKAHYGIPSSPHVIFAFHPVTTSTEESALHARYSLEALEHGGFHVVAIEPNNDFGSDLIRREIDRFRDNQSFSVFPSLRYERFLVLLRNAEFVIGNSSMGVREAPHYGVPSIDIGSRQMNRGKGPTIISVIPRSSREILRAIQKAQSSDRIRGSQFGDGRSADRFRAVVESGSIWEIGLQKHHVDQK